MRRQLDSVLLVFAVFSLLLAQTAFAEGRVTTGRRPLSAREGLTIVRQTSFVEASEGRTEDCSHFVHDIYEQAGYPYPYASSRDLYDGTENFARVRAPHPGDLVVWHGHVGIVINPHEHSFFSSVNSGPRTEYYNSTYWGARGTPRFYRYLTDSPLRGESSTTERASRGAVREPGVPGASGRGGNYGPTFEAVKTAPTKMPAVTAQSEEMVESGAGAVVAPQIVVHFSKKQPSAADVAQGLAATSRDAGEILRTGNLEKLGRPVMIYQDLRVTDVAIKGKRGSAQVEIDCLALLDGGRMEPQRDGEQLSLQLQRTKRGWAITLPTENSFVPRDAALRILAARLASLTQHDDTNEPKEHEQAQIIRLLSLLVIED